MANAVLLSRASTPAHVADVLADSVRALTGCQRVLVLTNASPHGMALLASRRYDTVSLEVLDAHPQDRGAAASGFLDQGRAVYAVGSDAIRGRWPLLGGIAAQSATPRMAVVPMFAADVVTGVVTATSDEVREWNDADRAVLAALTAQGGPALARAGVTSRSTTTPRSFSVPSCRRPLQPPQACRSPAGTCRVTPRPRWAGTGMTWRCCPTNGCYSPSATSSAKASVTPR